MGDLSRGYAVKKLARLALILPLGSTALAASMMAETNTPMAPVVA